jgi:iron complex outermembrane receptor protein
VKKLVLGAALLAPFAVLADEATVLEPVVVTATRSAQPDVRLPAALSVITADDIAASGATHVVDVLRSLGTAQITDLYGDGSRAQIDLRGFGDAANANTLILVDGRRLNNPDIAAPDLNSIALKDIERIEILHGSAGALYGDQAVGGVINIITRARPATSAGVQLEAGSYDSLRGQAVAGFARGGFGLRLSGETRHSDNYRDHNDLDYSNLLGRAGYGWNDGEVFAEATWINEDLLTPGALFADEVRSDRRQSAERFANDYSDTDTRVLRIGVQQGLGARWSLDAEASERRSDGRFRLGSFGLATQDSTQDRVLRAFTPRVSARYPFAGSTLLVTLGSDLQRADYTLSSQFGTQTNRQDLADVYGQAIVPLTAALDATLGLRHARVDNEVRDGFTFVDTTAFGDDRSAGQAGLSWRALDRLRLFAGYDRNYRFAKVDEFTNAGAAPASNTNLLDTQAGDSYESGAEWTARDVSLRVTLYRMEISNEIVFDPTTFSNINLDRTRRDGVTLDGRWQVIDALTLGAGAQLVDAQIRSGSFAGNPVPLVARRGGRLSAQLRLPLDLNAYAEIVATGPRGFAGDYDDTLDELPGHAVTNLALGWRWNKLSVRSRVNNLFGREYSEYGAAGTDPDTFAEAAAYQPSPERNFSLTLSYGL